MESAEFEVLYHEPVTLSGRFVTLTPLRPEHAEELVAALDDDEELWRYIPLPRPRTLEEMQHWIADCLEQRRQGRRIPFAVIANADGRVIGSTSYVNLSAADRHLDIGWTWYARAHWRSGVNTECKFLLLRHAFEVLHCIRVQFRVDARNLRSQRAVERIGGVREGVLRKVQLLHDGHQRDVAIYSILDVEWPDCKRWFEETLGKNFS